MRITDIEVDGFGIWSGLRLAELSPEITVFYGPNEAGKTTLLQFIRSVLYGFGEGRRERHLPPRYGGNWGGSLEVVAPSGAYRVERHLIREGQQRERETLAIESNDGVRRGTQFLEKLLCGIDETICTQVFAVGLHELQQLASLNDTEAAEQLYGLATGRDRVSLHDVARRVNAVRQQLAGDAHSRIQHLLHRQSKIRESLQQGSQHVGRWDRIREKWDELEKQIATLHAQKEVANQQIALIEACQLLRESWLKCRTAQENAARHKTTHAVPVKALLHLRELAAQLRNHRKQRQEILQRLQVIDPQNQFAPTKKRQSVRAGRSDGATGSLSNLDRQYIRLDDRVQQLTKQLEEVDHDIQSEWERNGLPSLKGSDQAVQQLLQLTPQAMNLLRPTARTVQQAERNAETLKQRYEATRRQLQETQQRTNAAAGLSDKDGDLYAAIRRAGEVVALLRRRLLLADNERQFDNYLGENRAETQHWLAQQLLPYPGLLGLALLFGAGGIMLIVPILGLDVSWWPGTRGTLWGLGLFVCFLAVMWKVWLQWLNDEGLAETERQAQRLRDRRHQLTQEIAQLERNLPPSQLPWSDRLRHAEQELADLEGLLAQDGTQAGLHTTVSTLQMRATQIEDAYRAAQNRWQVALRTLGLHDELPADKIDLLLENWPRLQQLRDRRTSVKRDRDAAQRERDTVAEKLDRILLAAGQDLPSSPLQRREVWAAFLRVAADNERTRKETQEKVAAIQRELKTVARSAHAIRQQQSASCIQYGIRNIRQVPELCAAHKMRQESQKLRKSFQKDLHEIAKQAGCRVDRLHKALQKNEDEETLQERRDQCRQQLQACDKKLEKLQEQRGAVQERMRLLQQDRTTEDRHRELAELEHDLAIATKRWRITSTVSQLLEQVRSRFERDRQPETLAEASVYLSRMTLNKYERIWTPFGEADLRIDTHENESLSVEQLSRGTREQVFLALRLALAAAYGRRGTRLPVVLDDVLVNFDVSRARAAAGMLKQFGAQGNQVLVFTCHEHIRDIFRELEVETRELPRAADVAGRLAQAPALTPLASESARESDHPETMQVASVARQDDPWDQHLFHARKPLVRTKRGEPGQDR